MSKNMMQPSEFAVQTALFQRRLLKRRLEECGGRVCEAAASLGIHRNTFDRVMRSQVLRSTGITLRDVRAQIGVKHG